MPFTSSRLTVMLASLLSLLPVTECNYFQPKFHYGFTTQGYYTDHQIIFRDNSRTSAILIYNTTYFVSGTSIRVVTTDDLEKWVDSDNLKLADTVGEHIFLTCDKNDNTGLFNKHWGYVLAVDSGEKGKHLFYKTDQEKAWTNSGKTLTGQSAPLSWISPIRCEKSKKWISEFWGKLLTSTDLQTWNSSDLALQLPEFDKDFKYIQEIFSISLFGSPNEMHWVIYIRKWKTKETSYLVGKIENSVMKFDGPKLTFDYGPDFNQLAIIGGCNYDNQAVIGLGTVKSEKFEKPNLIIQAFSAYPRVISLVKDPINHLKTLKFKPVPTTAVPSLHLTDTYFDAANVQLNSSNSKNFRMHSIVSFVNDVLIRFTVGKIAFFGYVPINKSLFLSVTNENSSLTSFDAPLNVISGVFELTLLFDECIIELFGNDDVCITVLVPPYDQDIHVNSFSSDSETKFNSLKVWYYL